MGLCESQAKNQFKHSSASISNNQSYHAIQFKLTTHPLYQLQGDSLILLIDGFDSLDSHFALDQIKETDAARLKAIAKSAVSQGQLKTGACLIFQNLINNIQFNYIVLINLGIWKHGKQTIQSLKNTFLKCFERLCEYEIKQIGIVHTDKKLGYPTNLIEKSLALSLHQKKHNFNKLSIILQDQHHIHIYMNNLKKRRKDLIQLHDVIQSDYY